MSALDLADNRLHVQRHRPKRWKPDVEREKDKAPADAMVTIRKVCAGERPWPILFWGEPGSRKTCTALLLLDYYGGLYFPAHRFHKRIIDADNGRLWEGASMLHSWEMWKEWQLANLTVLDELGRYGATPAACGTVQDCIDDRYSRAAVFITNLDPYKDRDKDGALSAVYDDRVMSRLMAGTQIRFTGDFRTDPKW